MHFKEENVREVVHVASVTKVAMVVVVSNIYRIKTRIIIIIYCNIRC